MTENTSKESQDQAAKLAKNAFDAEQAFEKKPGSTEAASRAAMARHKLQTAEMQAMMKAAQERNEKHAETVRKFQETLKLVEETRDRKLENQASMNSKTQISQNQRTR